MKRKASSASTPEGRMIKRFKSGQEEGKTKVILNLELVIFKNFDNLGYYGHIY
jgi:hypothetical protein